MEKIIIDPLIRKRPESSNDIMMADKINEIIEYLNKYEQLCLLPTEYKKIGDLIYQKAINMDNYIKKSDLKEWIESKMCSSNLESQFPEIMAHNNLSRDIINNFKL